MEKYAVYRLFIPAITIFHGIFVAYLFLSMFNHFQGWTMYHWRPFFMLLYALIWLLIQLRFKWAIIVYLFLTLFDGLCKYVFWNTLWGDALELTLFPLSIVFLAVLMLMYKIHFDFENEIE
jgi:hypothetical protein